MIEYLQFDFLPDFQDTPTLRWTNSPDITNSAPAPQFIQWPWLRSEFIQVFRFTDSRRTELARLKAFFEAVGGRYGAFVCPTWRRDLDVATLPSTGSHELILAMEDWAASHITTSRLDEEGRYVFCYEPAHGLFFAKVLSAVDGASLSTLTLEQPWPWAPTGQAIFGYARIVRFEDDTLDFEHVTEERATVQLTFRSLRCYSDLESEGLLDGLAIYELAPFEAYTALVEDLATWGLDVAYTYGPESFWFYESAQYETRWAAWYGSERVLLGQHMDGTITPPADGDGFPTELFDSLPTRRDHIALAFDQVGKEVVAYQLTATTIEIRRWFNNARRLDSFTGQWPILGFVGTLNLQAYIDNETDVFCLYIRGGFAKIFARMQRDNFAVEYTLNGSPTKPIALIRLEEELEGPTMTLVYVDDSFRVCRLVVTLPAQPAIPPSPYITGELGEIAGAALEASGEYLATIIETEASEGLGAALEALGEYTDDVLEGDGPPEATGLGLLATGEMVNDIRGPAPASDRAALAATATGVYEFAIQAGNPESDTNGISITATGVYDIPP